MARILQKYIKYIVSNIYILIVNISPFIEVQFRKMYWRNISFTSKLKKKNNVASSHPNYLNFNHILDSLRNKGILKGSIMIVHSSYDLLLSCGLTPEQINEKLLDFVGNEGTLVMPAIRRYKEEGGIKEHLTKTMDDIICTYNVQKSRITSGILPYYLTTKEDRYISRFPLNPVVAVGKHADSMMINNLEGSFPTPHGPNSSWKYCLDNNAYVVGLGVEMPHFLTLIHVNEECDPNWPIRDWYRKRKFLVKDNDFETYVEIFERKPIWGTLYFAERKLRRDLIKNGILNISVVNGLEISIIESQRLISFLRTHKRKGYPYYVESRHLIKN